MPVTASVTISVSFFGSSIGNGLAVWMTYVQPRTARSQVRPPCSRSASNSSSGLSAFPGGVRAFSASTYTNAQAFDCVVRPYFVFVTLQWVHVFVTCRYQIDKFENNQTYDIAHTCTPALTHADTPTHPHTQTSYTHAHTLHIVINAQMHGIYYLDNGAFMALLLALWKQLPIVLFQCHAGIR